MEKIFFASDLRLRLSWQHDSPELCLGAGSKRRTYNLQSAELLALLLTCPEGLQKEAFVQDLEKKLGTSPNEARKLVEFLLAEGIVVEAPTPHSESSKLWEQDGWQEALAFHKATQGLTFNRDPELYAKEMKERLAASYEDSEEAQPITFKYYPHAERIPLPQSDKSLEAVTLEKALRSSAPFRSYKPGAVGLHQLSGLLLHVYGVTSEHSGIIGHYFKRTSPSGGGASSH